MGLTCNINGKGRALRATLGGVAIVVGAGLITAGLLRGEPVAFGVPGAICIAGGLFGLFEAFNGWCAVRAMGFKTPL